MNWSSVDVTCSLDDSIAPLVGNVEAFNKAIVAFKYTNWSSVDIFRPLDDSIASLVGNVEAFNKAIVALKYTNWSSVDIFRPLDDSIVSLVDIVGVRKCMELTNQVYPKTWIIRH